MTCVKPRREQKARKDGAGPQDGARRGQEENASYEFKARHNEKEVGVVLPAKETHDDSQSLSAQDDSERPAECDQGVARLHCPFSCTIMLVPMYQTCCGTQAAYFGAMTTKTARTRTPGNDDAERHTIERVQTGVRIERRILLVLKALAASKGMSVGDLLEGIVLHAFEGAAPFGPESLAKIRSLKEVYGLNLSAADSHVLVERRAKRSGHK